MTVNVISKTKQEFKGKTYYLCGFYFQRNGVRLHRKVYEHHHGTIPDGHHVHHIDGNIANNDILNLALKKAGEHTSEHASTPERIAYARMHIERIRPLAAKWHGSEDGKEFHKRISKEAWKNRTAQTHKCVYCGKEYKTLRMYGANENTFCGNNCKTAHRRESGVDNEQRKCAICGERFIVNRYSKTKTCGKECRKALRYSNESYGNTLCRQN